MNELPTVRSWSGKRLSEYTEVDFIKQLKKRLAEILVITGGKMYAEFINESDRVAGRVNMMYKGQLNSIVKLLTNSFSFLTFEEIINAFYLNSAGKFGEVHSHYGRELNVEFIGNVLASYKKYKQSIFNEHGDNLVKAVKGELPAPEQKILTDEDYINDRRHDIENTYQRLIRSMEIEERLFPEYFYDQLVADGAIVAGLYERKLKEAKDKLAYEEHIVKMEKENAERKYSGSDDTKTDGEDRYADATHIGSHLNKLRFLARHGMLKKHQPVVTLSKQMIVKEYFMLCWRNNDPCIYGVKLNQKDNE